MTRERISKINDDDLIKLAVKLALDPFDDFDIDDRSELQLGKDIRMEIEEQIFELLEENRQEREQNDSHPVNYHQKHFLSIEELFGYPLEDEASFFTFPEQYNVTRIMLMLRDPEWAYSYWDISNQDRTRISSEPAFSNFAIVLKEVPGSAGTSAKEGPGPAPEAEQPIEMSIPVQLDDNNWYINLPKRNRSYTVELIARFGEREELVARSGEIRVPGGNFSPDLENINNQESEVLIALSGIEDLGVSAFEGSPRRLVEVLEQDNE